MLSHSLRCAQGGALIELAILFPVFLLLMLGTLQLALIHWGNGVLQRSLRLVANEMALVCPHEEVIKRWEKEGKPIDEGRLCAGSDITPEKILARITGHTLGIVKPERLCLTATPAEEDTWPPQHLDIGNGQQAVIYHLRYDWPVAIPFMRTIFSNHVVFQQTTMVRNQRFDTLSTHGRFMPDGIGGKCNL